MASSIGVGERLASEVVGLPIPLEYRWYLWNYLRSLLNVEVEVHGILPVDEPLIIAAAPHTGHPDGLLILLAGGLEQAAKSVFLVKGKYWTHFPYQQLMSLMISRGICVDDGDTAGVDDAIAVFNGQEVNPVLGVLVQGTRDPLQSEPIHQGFSLIAAKTLATVVPTIIYEPGELLMPKGEALRTTIGKAVRRKLATPPKVIKAEVHFLSPVRPTEIVANSKKELRQQIFLRTTETMVNFYLDNNLPLPEFLSA